MNDAALKAKVLFGFGVLVSFLGMLFVPHIIQALLPFAICVFIACAVLFLPELIVMAKRHLAASSRGFAQATPLFQSARSDVSVRVESIPHIDYDDYLIPTYLRRQEVK
jgi:uncharacterized membrane protein YdfJ with MMPL/SSD domain